MLVRTVTIFFFLTILNYNDASYIKLPSASRDTQQTKLEAPHVQTGVVALALANKGDEVGKGSVGTTYAVNVPISGHKAVLKVIEGQGFAYGEHSAKIEAQNLHIVDQYLGWGCQECAENDETWYFVMKDMGIKKDKAAGKGMSVDETYIKALHLAASARYETEFKMKATDLGEGNFVYQQKPFPTWRAEIIDWQTGEWKGGGSKPNDVPPKEVLHKPTSTANFDL